MTLTIILCISGFSFSVYADENKDIIISPQASEYISSSSVSMSPVQDGECIMRIKLSATRIVDVLGFKV